MSHKEVGAIDEKVSLARGAKKLRGKDGREYPVPVGWKAVRNVTNVEKGPTITFETLCDNGVLEFQAHVSWKKKSFKTKSIDTAQKKILAWLEKNGLGAHFTKNAAAKDPWRLFGFKTREGNFPDALDRLFTEHASSSNSGTTSSSTSSSSGVASTPAASGAGSAVSSSSAQPSAIGIATPSASQRVAPGREASHSRAGSLSSSAAAIAAAVDNRTVHTLGPRTDTALPSSPPTSQEGSMTEFTAHRSSGSSTAASPQQLARQRKTNQDGASTTSRSAPSTLTPVSASSSQRLSKSGTAQSSGATATTRTSPHSATGNPSSSSSSTLTARNSSKHLPSPEDNEVSPAAKRHKSYDASAPSSVSSTSASASSSNPMPLQSFGSSGDKTRLQGDTEKEGLRDLEAQWEASRELAPLFEEIKQECWRGPYLSETELRKKGNPTPLSSKWMECIWMEHSTSSTKLFLRDITIDGRSVGKSLREFRNLTNEPQNLKPNLEERLQTQRDSKKLQQEYSKNACQLNMSTLRQYRQAHNWPFGMIAELVDNARDACATVVKIDIVDSFKNNSLPALIGDKTVVEPCKNVLVVLDDGEGMSPGWLHRSLLMTAESEKQGRENVIGGYGLGLKTAGLGLGDDLTVLTAKDGIISVGVLSWVKASKSGNFEVEGGVLCVDENGDEVSSDVWQALWPDVPRARPSSITKHSPLQKPSDFARIVQDLVRLSGVADVKELHGTAIIISNLRKTGGRGSVVDVLKVLPGKIPDIIIPPPDNVRPERNPNHSPPKLDTSLRAYVSYFF